MRIDPAGQPGPAGGSRKNFLSAAPVIGIERFFWIAADIPSMNVGITIIRGRHSIREWKDDPVDEKIILDALECARNAPTAMNVQPWVFIAVRDRETLKQIAALTDHGSFIRDAPVCFAVFGQKNATYYLEDCSAATENIILALQSYGVGSCWVAGDKKPYADTVRGILKVPASYTLVSLVPAGFPKSVVIAPKKPLPEIAFFDWYEEETKGS